jgi:hypothetical protein
LEHDHVVAIGDRVELGARAVGRTSGDAGAAFIAGAGANTLQVPGNVPSGWLTAAPVSSVDVMNTSVEPAVSDGDIVHASCSFLPWIVHRRLERGTFTFPARVVDGAASVAIDVHELASVRRSCV